MNYKRIVSGVQPTGILHLGNYLGAVKNWKKYINIYHENNNTINENDSHLDLINSNLIFFIADNHSITLKLLNDEQKLNQKLIKIKENEEILEDKAEEKDESLNIMVKKTAACLIASGIDPKKCILFRQSDVPHHSELMWILSCITPQSWLKTMIQYKEKSKNNQLITSTGLFTYPILMAADILLYNAHLVPVGEDQIQHMELTKNLAERMNKIMHIDYFNIPQIEIEKNSNKIMSLVNGNKKMSKSEENKNSCINLMNTPEEIESLILKSKTDSINNIYFDSENRPEVSNLINIYGNLMGICNKEIEKKFENKNFKEFKLELIKVLKNEIDPIREKANFLLDRKDGFIDEILYRNSKKAEFIANENLKQIKKILKY
jgi:tryptophanyl-tRNA synthetase